MLRTDEPGGSAEWCDISGGETEEDSNAAERVETSKTLASAPSTLPRCVMTTPLAGAGCNAE
jgi:hypothetical protein